MPHFLASQKVGSVLKQQIQTEGYVQMTNYTIMLVSIVMPLFPSATPNIYAWVLGAAILEIKSFQEPVQM